MGRASRESGIKASVEQRSRQAPAVFIDIWASLFRSLSKAVGRACRELLKGVGPLHRGMDVIKNRALPEADQEAMANPP